MSQTFVIGVWDVENICISAGLVVTMGSPLGTPPTGMTRMLELGLAIQVETIDEKRIKVRKRRTYLDLDSII